MIDPAQVKVGNIAQLQAWGIPVIEHLPTLEAASELSPPSAADVARRAMVLCHVVGIGFGGNPGQLRDAVQRYGLWPSASEKERALLSQEIPTEQDRINASWTVECLQSFAWCFGLAELPHLRHCDDDLATKFPKPFSDPSDFIAGAKLRSFGEIYREADLHYRVHWAARNARLTGAAFPVSEGLIGERRKALDWVIGVEANWDEVPDNT